VIFLTYDINTVIVSKPWAQVSTCQIKVAWTYSTYTWWGLGVCWWKSWGEKKSTQLSQLWYI